MAKYHNNLSYHADTIEKHSITEEEKEFLRNLQKEMNTQDTCGNASPRFWVIKGREKLYHCEDDIDGYILYDNQNCDYLAETFEELVNFIKNEILDEINDLDGIQRKIELRNDTIEEYISIFYIDEDGDEIEEKRLCSADDVKYWLDEYDYSDYEVYSYKWVAKIYPDTMFLTQKAAEEHLKANHYHYDETAHTYAMTAVRSPEVEKLFNILQSVQW